MNGESRWGGRGIKVLMGLTVCLLEAGWMNEAQATALPTSGSCGIEINRVLSGGDNAVWQQLAASFGTVSQPFDLSVVGVLDFTRNTWSMSRLTRQYGPTAPVTTPTDTVTIVSGTMAPGTPGPTNPPGTYSLVLTLTGYVLANSTSAATGVAPSHAQINLLVMPINSGKTLLIQNQTGGNGGGICQF